LIINLSNNNTDATFREAIKRAFSKNGVEYEDKYKRVFMNNIDMGNFVAYQFKSESWDFNNMDSRPKDGDAIFNGNHVYILHRVMFDQVKNKYLFLLSEANSPADGATGEARIYLIDQDTFETRVGRLDQVYFLRDTHQEPTLDPAYLKPGEPQPKYIPIEYISDAQRQNFQTAYTSNPSISTDAIKKAEELLNKCGSGVGGRNNACIGEMFNGEILTDNSNVNTDFANDPKFDEFDSNMFSHCTDLLINVGVALGADRLDKIENYSVTNMQNDFVAHSALLSGTATNQVQSGMFAFRDNEKEDTNGALIHAGIVTERTISGSDIVGLEIAQVNSVEPVANYLLDNATGKFIYEINGEKLYIDS